MVPMAPASPIHKTRVMGRDYTHARLHRDAGGVMFTVFTGPKNCTAAWGWTTWSDAGFTSAAWYAAFTREHASASPAAQRTSQPLASLSSQLPDVMET